MSMRDKSMAIGLGFAFAGIGFIFLNVESFRVALEDTNEYLEGAALYPSVPIGRMVYYLPSLSVLDIIGMTLCCWEYRKNVKSPKSWFESLLSCMLMQLGGTTLAGFLLGQVPGWMMGDATLQGCLLSWWLVFCCPYDLYWRFLNSHPIVLFVYGFLGVFNCGHGVTSWGVDKALNNTFHINAEDISFTNHKSYTLSDPPKVMAIGNYKSSKYLNNSFLLSTLYYILVNRRSFINMNLQLPLPTAHAVILLIQYYCFFLEVLAPDFDVCQKFSTDTLQLLGVPSIIMPMANSNSNLKDE